MQKRIASLIVVGLLLLAACGTDDEAEPGPITSFENIAGITYERQGPGCNCFFYFFEDGTWHRSSNPDLIMDRPSDIMEARFEGTTLFLKQTKGMCDDDPDAIYEIHLLENGNLQLVAIEDACAQRSGLYEAEYAPIP